MRASRAAVVCLLLGSGSAAGGQSQPDSFAALDLSEPSREATARQEEEAAAAPATGRRPPARPPALPPACLDREPGAGELVTAAWRQAGLEATDDASRARRLAVAGWLPKLSGGLRYDLGDRWAYRYEPGEPRVDQLNQDDGLSWDVDLSWDLSRIAFDKDELAVAREAVRRASERRELAVEVLRLAYARRGLALAGLPAPGTAEREQWDEATALLDAWTGGAFGGRWCGGGS